MFSFTRDQNQRDAPISQIYAGMNLYMFRTVTLPIIRTLLTVHSALVLYHTGLKTALRAGPGWNAVPSWSCTKTVEFHAGVNLEIGASRWFYYKEICYDAQSHEFKKKSQPSFGFGWIPPSDKYCRKVNHNNILEVHTFPMVQIYHIQTDIVFVRSPKLIPNLLNINLPTYPPITNLIWFRTRIFGNNIHRSI